MDNRRLLYAISISLAILVIFQVLGGYFLPKPPPRPAVHAITNQTSAPPSAAPGAPAEAGAAASAKTAAAPRLVIDAPSVKGSMSLLGARLDDLVLTHYHKTVAKTSPLVRLLSRSSGTKPYYVQFGWDAAPGSNLAVPGPKTLWTSSGGVLAPGHDVTLSWDNGAGVTFQLLMAIDSDYMFTVQQRVVNQTGAKIEVFPWSRIRRDYLPSIEGTYILHKGPIGTFKGTLHEMSYVDVRSNAKRRAGTAFQDTDIGGWAGITGKYWLTALIPSQGTEMTGAYRYLPRPGHPKDAAYQVDYMTAKPVDAAPGAAAQTTLHVFAGAKVLHILNAYQHKYRIPLFEKAIDFGWFFFLTKPIFLALDYFAKVFGNFGVSIIVFTVLLKVVLFPLVRTSYRSMGKMRAVTPKVQALRERFKDDQVQQQKEIMALYKAEGVNPAAGCLPMLLQIPIFFSLYKVIFISIGMRHAPFILWIHDLSAEDPTNIFNLFGLIPFHPGTISPFLHLGVLPIIMGLTMWGQQRLNPPPPDPTQAKMMQFMPVIFTFMLGRFSAGLVLYYCVNNTLTLIQQWLIMRNFQHHPRHPADAKV
ncbi:membrane protein insertase YidC [Acidiphilium sp. AL]|uniref:Membrane protein insertase YidC n=1 Tax=Acidiphilium iwatense TaxID=768198 RepID=A0ABS9DZH4_9PROT|nr:MULTISPECIES: membrane protein insertase YidC [Acidiphilium]MCF3946827.1 membrane protein insertase YidC [Acidiphilium iwatense]MCU4160856.1 membrane protein insertase YidC [Acidiphilium sp. AL]